ncbi:HD domain-containing protein [Colwellia sp. MB02u-18]|uniref:HD domain-containing protein n=1 Tax=unclassified Colwellia TaxID=196834 RepID=UPI0015F4D6BF|nr:MULTISPECIES: HD domain-containing protein [unclassified Colwellia]MBA6224177.1 HD domain-containing protein [Colwellia sp. MB3u-45]MBA6268307.1 HD domain-containing protein [Colwellia sp. MB3u-43]MBA6322741.1 HD domain-containing protein [Colwellia sp. MB02u-19]MBA6323509.1 HD domain-containing protein [Colwellia sp. MB02u-18]MBA6332884.1 HD domain-containing protein [Colwellia sp. MB02u-12]
MQDLKQQLDFILELDRLKAVYRKVMVKSDKNRPENSAEHSWHIAMMAQTLHVYAAEPVNVARVTSMLLIHDIVEIDAGDTFAFAAQVELDAQEAKELAAAKRIFGLLPEQQCSEMLNLWLEFEAAETTDAKFAKAMDRVLPLLQNMKNDGGSWAKHNVSRSEVIARNNLLDGLAPKLWTYVAEQIEFAVEKGWLRNA